jgi:hypothetical protein
VVGRDAVTMLSLTAIDLPARESARCGQYLSLAIVGCFSYSTELLWLWHFWIGGWYRAHWAAFARSHGVDIAVRSRRERSATCIHSGASHALVGVVNVGRRRVQCREMMIGLGADPIGLQVSRRDYKN